MKTRLKMNFLLIAFLVMISLSQQNCISRIRRTKGRDIGIGFAMGGASVLTAAGISCLVGSGFLVSSSSSNIYVSDAGKVLGGIGFAFCSIALINGVYVLFDGGLYFAKPFGGKSSQQIDYYSESHRSSSETKTKVQKCKVEILKYKITLDRYMRKRNTNDVSILFRTEKLHPTCFTKGEGKELLEIRKKQIQSMENAPVQK